MAFIKKTWKDKIAEYPNRRILTDNDGKDTVVTVTRDEGTISQVGDPLNANTMNDLELRIESAITKVETVVTTQSDSSHSSESLRTSLANIFTDTTLPALSHKEMQVQCSEGWFCVSVQRGSGTNYTGTAFGLSGTNSDKRYTLFGVIGGAVTVFPFKNTLDYNTIIDRPNWVSSVSGLTIGHTYMGSITTNTVYPTFSGCEILKSATDTTSGLRVGLYVLKATSTTITPSAVSIVELVDITDVV